MRRGVSSRRELPDARIGAADAMGDVRGKGEMGA
jgi:hypothetical protein